MRILRAIHLRDPSSHYKQVRTACPISDRVEGWRDADLPLVTTKRGNVTCRSCKKTKAFKSEETHA